jgi:hypothetical protein
MVNVLASSAVDRGFAPQSDQTKDYKIDICCFSAEDAALSGKTIHVDYRIPMLKHILVYIQTHVIFNLTTS